MERINRHIEQFKNSEQRLDPAGQSLKKMDIKFVQKLSHLIDMHPCIKKEQSKYIAEKALLIADVLEISAEMKNDILYAGLLMNLGKIGLPDRLLTKPFYSMSIVDKYRYLGHAVDGEALLQPLPRFKGAATLIRHQYEHYNGQGFPDGLAEHRIPVGARILSVVSNYIAHIDGLMTGKEMFGGAALSHLMIQKESYYDPEIVDIFSSLLRGMSIEEIKQEQANAKLLTIATQHWKKGLVIKNRNKPLVPSTSVVEIALPQLKSGMKVDSIYFGRDPYIRNCVADQSIIDSVTALTKQDGRRPIIKICLDIK